MNNENNLLKEKERINQKINFYKKYIGHLIRIAVGSFITTLIFVSLIDEVGIDLSSLKISTVSLIFLASLPTMIPLIVSYLLYKQLPELITLLKDLHSKLNKN